MQTYLVRLESPISTSFRCVKAANSVDLNVEKKSVHELRIEADVTSDFEIGVIYGASGSGKSTLAQQIFGANCFFDALDLERPVIEQFAENFSYDDCANALSGIGLSQVPCWVRPAKTLSNGQRARAVAALAISESSSKPIVLDEWTSVVDRTVAKAMSHTLQKHARKHKKKIVLCSCHSDVLEWLQPDWIIDCNAATFTRLDAQHWAQKKNQLRFDVRYCDKRAWRMFSKYHYLSDKLPCGRMYTFGLYHGAQQIGFQCFAEYVPSRKGKQRILHSNRVVIHPDYCGFGLGMKMVNATSQIIRALGYRVMTKFSSVAMFKMTSKDSQWALHSAGYMTTMNPNLNRKTSSGYRNKVRWWSFEYVG